MLIVKGVKLTFLATLPTPINSQCKAARSLKDDWPWPVRLFAKGSVLPTEVGSAQKKLLLCCATCIAQNNHHPNKKYIHGGVISCISFI